jgi:hypothetical protein
MTTQSTHSERYRAQLVERARRGDHEAAAVLVVLSEPWAWAKAVGHIDDDGIDFASMLFAHDEQDALDGTCQSWDRRYPGEDQPELGFCKCGVIVSHGERLLLTLAWNLWHGRSANAIDVSELLDTCGDGFLSVAFAAIEARNGRPLPIRISVSRPS